MSLPQRINYDAPVPPLVPLPDSRADWRLEPARAALLVHDLQHYFLRPYDPDCGALRGALAQTARLLGAARAAGVPVYYTAQRGDQVPHQRGLQGDLWGPGMRAVPEHTTIVEQVAPVSGDVVLDKHRYSAFAQSDLAERLAAQGRDQLVITGVYAHIGITATAFDAFMREVHPFVVADAVADFGPEQHVRALQQVASCSGVVTLTEAVTEAFARDEVEARGADGRGAPWGVHVRQALVGGVDEEFARAAFEQPDRDLFELGLNSLRAFEVLDLLAEQGVDLDFGEFTRRPTLAHLLECGDRGALLPVQ